MIGYSNMIGMLEKIGFPAVKLRGVFIGGFVCFLFWPFTIVDRNLLLQHAPLLLLDFVVILSCSKLHLSGQIYSCKHELSKENSSLWILEQI